MPLAERLHQQGWARKLVKTVPGARGGLWLAYYAKDRKKLRQAGGAREIFTNRYAEHSWGGEDVSGPGSDLRYTENIRIEIPKLVSRLGVETILDAPCGDYHWFREMAFEGPVSYIGGDIVAPLIAENQAAYADDDTRFMQLDITQDPLPPADLWLCRDCLFHLSNRDIRSAIDAFLESDIRYLLTSTHSDCPKNRDMPTGSFRFLNLRLEPFCFPEPIDLIDDWIEGFPVRHLGLWEREALRRSLTGSG